MNTLMKVASSLAVAVLVLAATVAPVSAGRIAPDALAPAAFGKVSPVVGATDVPVYATLKWSASAGAASYRYCFDTSNNGICDTAWVDIAATQVTLLTPLVQNTTYYWQVVAVNGPDETYADANTWWSFATGLLPGAFSKSLPATGAVNQNNSVTLTWGASSNVTKYEYCYNAGSTSCSTWYNNGTSTSVAISALAWNTVYYWQVRAVNSVGTIYANDGAYSSFTTAAVPSSVTKSSPSNGAANQPTSIILSWSTTSSATSYRVCYDTVNNSACDTSWTEVGNVSSTTISGLSQGTTYYWQVQASSYAGSTDADSGFWFVFSTIPAAPSSFAKSSPAPGAINQPNSVTLKWNTASGAASYEYCYGATQSCSSWTNVGNVTQTTISGLSDGAMYYWHVRAINAGGTTYSDSNSWWSFTVAAAPAEFNKLLPVNNAVNQPTTVTLSWQDTTGETGYDYCYDDIDDGNCSGWVSAGTNTSVTISSLTKGKTYYWQVRAKAGSKYTEADKGAHRAFTVASDPSAFTKSTPANGTSNITTSSIALTWASSTNAVSYEYCFDSTINNTCSTAWTSAGANLTTTIPLDQNKTYEWQVRAVNAVNTVSANSGTWWTFSTTALPGAFVKSSPANNSTGVPTSTTLIWSASTGAASYDYCLSTTTSCNTWTGNGTSTSKVLSGLTPGAKYYWRVRANNANGSTLADAAGAVEWNFTVSLGAFGKTAPVNGATGISTSPTLTWSSSAGAILYEYCFGTSSTCTTWTGNGTSTSKALTGLTTNTTYYWHIRAKDSLGNYSYSDGDSAAVWSFTTGSIVIGDFTKSSPVNGASGQPTSLTISWAALTGASGYEYCYDKINNNACDATWNSVTGTSKTLSLSSGTTYYWQVRAIVGATTVEANSGAWWRFVTKAATSTKFYKVSPVKGSTGVSLTPTLKWSSFLSRGFYYCYDTINNNKCDTKWRSVPASQNSVILPTLVKNTTYYWQVYAVTKSGNIYANGATTWWSFKTGASPSPFSKIAPVNGAIGIDSGFPITLSWAPSANAEGYSYCIDTNGDLVCSTEWVDVGMDTSVEINGLEPGVTYNWLVRSNNSFGSTYADFTWWTFHTVETIDDIDGTMSFDSWEQVSDSDASDGMYYASSLLDSKIVFSSPAATTIILDTYVGPDQGIVNVCIDAACQDIDLYSASGAFTSFDFGGLSNAAHTVKLTVTGSRNALSSGDEIRFDGYKAAGTVYSNLHSSVQYGGWKTIANPSALNGYYRVSTTPDSKIRFEVPNSAFALLVTMGPTYGIINVYVDGEFKGFYDLYNSTTVWQYQIEMDGLGVGNHLIEIEVKSSGTGGVIIDGYKAY